MLKGRLIISKKKVIEMEVAKKKERNFLAVLYSINKRKICAYIVPMLQIFVKAFFLFGLFFKVSKSKSWESISKLSGK